MTRDEGVAISVDGLTKEFISAYKEPGLRGSFKAIFKPQRRTTKAVDNISFTVRKGEIVGFIGPNGAGKSTTIKMLTGILHPTSGEAAVLGLTPWKARRELAYRIGSVFGQKPQLWYHLPAIDTFNLFSKIYDLEDEEYRKRLNYLVDAFEIKEFLNKPVRKLSLGERMRCEVASSLLHHPEVIFLDEPTIGLDIIAKQKIRELIKEINRKEKTTVLLTSHDMQDIEHLCNRIIVINHGRIIYDGDITTLNKRYIKTKMISVKFGQKEKRSAIPGVKIISFSAFAANLEVDIRKTTIKAVMDRIMKLWDIADITISDPPIEEIIAHIYREK